MGKIKLYIFTIGLLVSFPAFAVDPVTAGYFLASTFSITVSMTVATVVAFVANYAISTIINRTFSKKPPKMQDNGVRQQIPPASTNSIPVVYGTAFLGGTFVDAVLTTDQKTMFYVLAISNISSNGQFTFDKTQFYYGDRLITFDATDKAKVVSLTDGSGNVDTKIDGNLWIYLYRSTTAGVITNLDDGGTAPFSGAPNTIMSTANGVPAGLEWPASGRQMNGLAFAIVKLVYSQEDDAVQLQQLTFNCTHALNSTGVAKPGDVWLDYITNSLYGGAISASLVNTTSATALNTYSDQTITFTDNQGNPSTQPRYRINGVIDTGETVLENLDKILMAADSWMAYDAPLGQWSIVINKPESVALAFNDTNIIGDIRVGTVDINQSINQIEARFPSKLNKDIPDYVFLATPNNLLYPNEPVNKYTLSLDLVNNSVQAQYLCNRMLEQAREDLIVTISTTYAGIQINAGDVVSVTNTVYGWNAKLFRVTKVNETSLPDGSLGAALELNEYNVQIYDDKPITEFQPTGNSDIPSAAYFSALTAPTVVSSSPSATIPTFDVQVFVPVTGRVTYGQLFYTTTPTPLTTDWVLLYTAGTPNGQAVANNINYIFEKQFLPAGTYYFAYLVGNELGTSGLSPISTAFVWTPVGMVGPTGPTGTTGPSVTGPTGPRSASGFVYYSLASSSTPSAPTLSGFDFTTGTFSSISANWSTTFNAPDPVTNASTQAGSLFWAVRYNVSEATYGGSQSISTSAVFNWQNFDGLVTFTNVTSPSGTTFIDGGNIIADTISANTIKSNTTTPQNAAYNYTAFGLGTSSSFNSIATGAQFISNNSGYFGMIAANTGGGSAGAFGTTATTNSGTAVAAVGYANSTFTTWSGHFLSGGNGNLQSGIAAEIRLAYYTGGTAYAFYISSGASFPFTGGHDALQLLTENVPEQGDLMVDVQLIAAPNINDAITQMSVSTSANQKGVSGVFVSVSGNDFVPAALGQYVPPAPGQAVGTNVLKPEFANIYDTYRPLAVNGLGEGKVNVCGQGGNIAIGDLIVASDMPGKGMKQSDDVIHSYTVAKAREAVTFSSPTEVKQIACIYMCG
jgi:hypothetical protein